MTDVDPKFIADLTSLNERLSGLLSEETAKDPNAIAHRISRLEDRIDRVWEDHAETKKNTAILEERISHLPTKPDLWKGLGALFAGFAALIAFSEKLQGLVK